MSNAQRTTVGGARTAWPSAAQYNEAIQNLRVTMGDEELRGGEAAVNALGLPMPYAGGFADIYKVRCPATGNTWAVKCFTRGATGLRERYAEISRHLDQTQLPFMVDFRYLDEGVRVNGAWYPIVKMRWIEGLNLNAFVARSVDQPAMLDQLFGLWVKVAGRLRAAGIAHADLQHGNVLLIQLPGSDKLGLRLIDYDGMYVPTLAGQRSGEVGHPAFQHPRRLREGTYNVEVDRFSHLAICSALRCLRVGGRALWQRFDNDNLLFGERDFAAPGSSALFRELWQLGDPEARGLVGRLALATQRPLEETPWIDELVADGRVRPLQNDQLRAARALLDPSSAVRALPVARPLPATLAATTVVPAANVAGPSTGVADLAPFVIRTSRPRRGTAQGAAWPRALIGTLDGWLARVAGGRTQHQMLRAVTGCALVFALVLAGLSIRWLASRSNPRPDASDVAGANRAEEFPDESTRVASTKKARDATAGTGSAAIAPTGTTAVSPIPGRPAPTEPQTSSAVIPPTETPGSTPKPADAAPTLAVAPFQEPEAKQHQQSWANHTGLPVEREITLPNDETLSLILIPPGEFEREENNQKYGVRLTQPFYLGKYEVTQAQWQSVMGSNPSAFKDDPKKPVETVSWDDIQPFLAKLNERESTGGLRFDLPTEAQWEYACRAGTTGKYGFSDAEQQLDQHAWHDVNADRQTHPVGRKMPNAWGLYDMHGNVQEWCFDWIASVYFAQAPSDDPRGPSEGSARVVRGGSWGDSARFCRLAFRNASTPTFRDRSRGFRVAAIPSDAASSMPAAPASNSPVIPSPATPPIPSKSKDTTLPLAVVPFNETEARQHQEVAAKLVGWPVEKEIAFPGNEKLILILIPPGEFTRSEGNQQFPVRLTKPFYLGKYELTQAQWLAVMGETLPNATYSPTNPVENVSWDQIQSFLQKLNKAESVAQLHFDLPTEAQWEFACRAGTDTAFSFGDRATDLPRYGWIRGNAKNRSHPVGQLKPNQFGLYDMHGNVSEWCSDWLVDYAQAPRDDPSGTIRGPLSFRVIRGGDWVGAPLGNKSALRGGSESSGRRIGIGFRVAAELSSLKLAEPAKP